MTVLLSSLQSRWIYSFRKRKTKKNKKTESERGKNKWPWIWWKCHSRNLL